ncbi:hypothetical protein DFQ28_005639 [Apophysomyces sp. BC1034]|nr:hypothetical protein DFQ29_010131 [Apophysomyces sp. BC1021]KAG0168770.1 hypothetical protein DFQ30_004346 [Apophysomyces sp. BC1015]KAG0187959.1 hypothetical protein DFQ28_005639 [Apophysomyces sp. BC1034]
MTRNTLNKPKMEDGAFPSLGDVEEDKRKHSAWSDTNTVKKKVISPALKPDDDPFAGMNQFVDYQQEIERLKALVPKVEAKRRTLSRPKSTGSEPSSSLRLGRGSWNDSGPRPAGKSISTKSVPPSVRRGPTSPVSRTRPMSSLDLASATKTKDLDGSISPSSTSPTSSGRITPILSPTIDTPTTFGHDQVESQTLEEKDEASTKEVGPAITEEEKTRFLEFVRSWTGGLKGWESQGGIENMKKAGSLWAEESPWDSTIYRRSEPQRRDLVSHSERLFYDMSASSPFTLGSGMNDVHWQTPGAVSPMDTESFMNFQRQIAPPASHGAMRWNEEPSLHMANSAMMRPYLYREDQPPRGDMFRHSMRQHVGTIGEKYRPSAPEHGIVRMNGNGKTPFGVFVM